MQSSPRASTDMQEQYVSIGPLQKITGPDEVLHKQSSLEVMPMLMCEGDIP